MQFDFAGYHAQLRKHFSEEMAFPNPDPDVERVRRDLAATDILFTAADGLEGAGLFEEARLLDNIAGFGHAVDWLTRQPTAAA